LSDLDPQQVASRATGHFQPCFPARRPVSRPVFASKSKTMSSPSWRRTQTGDVLTRGLTVETVRGATNIRHEGNRVRGTIIIITTVVTVSFSGPICVVHPRRIIQLSIKTRVRPTSPTFMCDAQVNNQGNRSRSVGRFKTCLRTLPFSLFTSQF
jgi:hypothetical protein